MRFDEARRIAGEWRSQVARGIDPAVVEAERRAAEARERAMRIKHSFTVAALYLVTYLRLLDADAEGADWRDVARIVLHLDPEREFDRAQHRNCIGQLSPFSEYASTALRNK
jgi:hypothetical protein